MPVLVHLVILFSTKTEVECSGDHTGDISSWNCFEIEASLVLAIKQSQKQLCSVAGISNTTSQIFPNKSPEICCV